MSATEEPAVVCGTPAGTNNARLGGSTHVVSPTPTVTTPLRAHISWWVGWVCVSYRVPRSSVNRPTSAAPTGGSSHETSWPKRDMAWQATWFRPPRGRRSVDAMPMNAIHRKLCQSDGWATAMRTQVLPWAVGDVPLDGDVLELGPGYGITTRWLADHGGRLTAVEVDPTLAADLRKKFDGEVNIHDGDATALPFADKSFDAVVCFTMLHHVPSPEQQNQLFAEAMRVLRPGGVFAGSDSRLSLRFRIIHIGDTMIPVPPDTLPNRLATAGFERTRVGVGKRSIRFRATR